MQNQSSVTQELIGLEKKFWQAMQKKDLDTALSLTSFPCIVAGSQGVMSVDEDQFTEMFNSEGKLQSFEIGGSPSIRLLDENTAIVAYDVHSVMTKDGRDQATDAIDTSTWIKRDGKWLCAHHTEVERAKH
jgi:ketosteroid isomerase-like protein